MTPPTTTEPRTEAGRALDNALGNQWSAPILAIEAEATRLALEGVKRAIDGDPYPADAHAARRILAPVLALLSPTPASGEIVCRYPFCGLPERLHGAPPGEPPNPTLSTHRFVPASGEPERAPEVTSAKTPNST